MNDPKRLTDGARQLRAYLDERGLSLLAFCKANELDYAWVYRQLSGERGQRVSVDFAKAIFDATGGVVDWRAWSSDTLHQTAA